MGEISSFEISKLEISQHQGGSWPLGTWARVQALRAWSRDLTPGQGLFGLRPKVSNLLNRFDTIFGTSAKNLRSRGDLRGPYEGASGRGPGRGLDLRREAAQRGCAKFFG